MNENRQGLEIRYYKVILLHFFKFILKNKCGKILFTGSYHKAFSSRQSAVSGRRSDVSG